MQWSILRIHRTYDISERTIGRFRKRILNDPLEIARLPVMERVGATGKSYRCRFCGETRPQRARCFRHVMSHVLPFEVARDYPLDGLDTGLL